MGQGCCAGKPPPTKMDGSAVLDLSQKTGLNISELREYYLSFMKEYPSGQLNKKEFREVYKNFFPADRDAREKAEHVFQTYDQNNDGSIDFREFMVALSVMSKGTLVQKLSLAFYLYDENGDGVLTFDEVLDIVKAMYGMASGPCSAEGLPEPEVFAKGLFSELDQDNDGEITLDEFTEVGCKDATVANLLLANVGSNEMPFL